jgi:hypothetical protein
MGAVLRNKEIKIKKGIAKTDLIGGKEVVIENK